jgi:putative transposase
VGRLARVIALGVAHHVTQRGNGRRFLLDGDADRRIYLDLLQQNLRLNDVLLVGYCLMSSHVLLIVIPGNEEGLALSLKHTHGRYASYWNVVHNLSGHAWEGRYYSCPLDRPLMGSPALHGTEPGGRETGHRCNVPALVSAAAHCGSAQADKFLSMELWRTHWENTSWSKYLAAAETETELASIRQCTHTCRPLGTQEFVHSLEEAMERRLVPQKGGRPAKPRPDARQADLHFDP